MTNITLISGSTLGNAEYVAEYLEEKLRKNGFATNLLHGPDLNTLPLTDIWLIVTSTYGAGELPANLQPFSDAIAEQQPDLSGIRYGAVGIGNHEYDLFCGAIRHLDRLLQEQGALRLGDRLEIDVLEHEIPEDPAGEWVTHWQTLIND
ncbi:FMN-binding protein MioC [Enterobacteriaceae bacterium LUAb1]